jgi:hypothetical protein
MITGAHARLSLSLHRVAGDNVTIRFVTDNREFAIHNGLQSLSLILNAPAGPWFLHWCVRLGRSPKAYAFILMCSYYSHIDWHLDASVYEAPILTVFLSESHCRGFAVVLAEDAPDVAAANPVPGT